MRGLPRQVKASLEKAHDSALLAVEVYNKPAVKFKSGGYITLMVIAWTALFHAIFFKRKIKPYKKDANGHFVRPDGDFRYWELDECLRRYFESDTGNPVRINLEFFIPLRNQIEHRSMPQLDATIFGECQAMLLNFDSLVEEEFGLKYCLRECLSFSLQLFPSSQGLVAAVKENPEHNPIVDFIQRYRSTISPEVNVDGKYSFKALLIQVANHEGESFLPIQFMHYDNMTEEQRAKTQGLVAMIKVKEVPVSNLNDLKTAEVVHMVQDGLGNPKAIRGGKEVDFFTSDAHMRCWRKYGIRGSSKGPNPHLTQKEYCI